jgi:choline/glycine/proline betaine transport protein
VGIFIARISKGRTVREFLLNVLIVPVLFTFFWFSVFGTSALELELAGVTEVGEAIQADLSTALFVMLEQYPLSIFTSIVGIVLVTSFFVTSSDSGSLVVDMLTSGGALDAPVGQRIFWAITEGAVAAALLLGGGLKAMQSMSIAAGIPYAFLVLVMIFSIRKGLHAEWLALPESKKPMGPKPQKAQRPKRKKR